MFGAEAVGWLGISPRFAFSGVGNKNRYVLRGALVNDFLVMKIDSHPPFYRSLSQDVCCLRLQDQGKSLYHIHAEEHAATTDF